MPLQVGRFTESVPDLEIHAVFQTGDEIAAFGEELHVELLEDDGDRLHHRFGVAAIVKPHADGPDAGGNRGWELEPNRDLALDISHDPERLIAGLTIPAVLDVIDLHHDGDGPIRYGASATRTSGAARRRYVFAGTIRLLAEIELLI